MSNLDEHRLRQIVEEVVEEVVRRALDEFHSAASREREPEKLLSTRRAAELAGVRQATIRAWITRGDLPGYRAGRHLRVKWAELQTFLAGSDGATPPALRKALRGH